MNLSRSELKSAIIGMVMGDGHISRRGKIANLQINHCERQLEYLLWKKSILNQIVGSSVTPTKKTMPDGKVHTGYRLWVHAHPLFFRLRNRFYYRGHRAVDEYLVKKITPLALAILFMDDGGFQREGNRRDTFYICTQNFDYANQMLIKKSLKIKYDLDWTITKVGKAKAGHPLYRLRLACKCNDKFISIIEPYVRQVDCMIYKLGSYANLPQDGSDTVRPL